MQRRRSGGERTSTRSCCRSCSSNRTCRAAEVALVQAQGCAAAERGLREPIATTSTSTAIWPITKYSVTLDDLKREALAVPARLAARAERRDTRRAHAGRSRSATAPRDITGGLEYDRAGSLNALGFTFSIDLPFHDRNQGNIAHSKVALRQATELQALATQHRPHRRRQRLLRRIRRAKRSWRSISPATSIRRSSRSTSRPTCISTAAARCSTCSTPSARIARRSWRSARRWRRT